MGVYTERFAGGDDDDSEVTVRIDEETDEVTLDSPMHGTVSIDVDDGLAEDPVPEWALKSVRSLGITAPEVR
jgi:hypothetical protein